MDNEANLNKKTNKKLILIIAMVVVLVAALVVTLLLLKKDDKKPVDPVNNVTDNNGEGINVEPLEDLENYQMKDNNISNFDLAFMQMADKKENMIYSPLSIKYVLSMLEVATKGDSKDQINGILGEYVSPKYKSLEQISVANALFVKSGLEKNLKDEFKKNLNIVVDIDIKEDSFENAKNINNWVKETTLNLIDKLYEDYEVEPMSYIFINALGINIGWMKNLQNEYSSNFAHEKIDVSVPEYDSDNRVTYDFNGKKVNGYTLGAVINNYDLVSDIGEASIRSTVGNAYTEYVNSQEYLKGTNVSSEEQYVNGFISDLKYNYKKSSSSTDFKVYVDDSVKVFSKNLKDYNGKQLEYIAIMPQKVDLDSFIKNTTDKEIKNYVSSLKSIDADNFEEGYVTIIKGNIPEFKFDYQLDLDKGLAKLGITDIFNANKSNFTAMTDKQGYYVKTRHKAIIDFSNDGIKAAAVTSAGATETAFIDEDGYFNFEYEVPTKEIDITIDKPFMFLIKEIESGEVWFAGNVYNPVEAK